MSKRHYGKKGIAWLLAAAFIFTGIFCTTTAFGGQEEPSENDGADPEIPAVSSEPEESPSAGTAAPINAGDVDISMVWFSGGEITESGRKINADTYDNKFPRELRLLLTFKINKSMVDLEPNGVEIIIPRSILKAGPGRVHTWVNFSPTSSSNQGQELEVGLGRADEKEHESGFYYSLTSDEIVIKNYKAISASSELQCEIVYFYTPSQIESGYCGTLKAQYSLEGRPAGETALLSYQINTKVAAGTYTFDYNSQIEKYETWPIGLDPALQQKYMPGKNPNDYIYMVYQATYKNDLTCTQPYTVKQTIANLSDYDAIIVGSCQKIERFSGITDFRAFGGLEQLEHVFNLPYSNNYNYSDGNYRTWIVAAYPKAKLLKPGAALIEEGTPIKAVLKAELTGLDYSRDPQSSSDSVTLENIYSYKQANVIQVPEGSGYMSKGGLSYYSDTYDRFGAPFQILENDKPLNLIRSDLHYTTSLYEVTNTFQSIQLTQSHAGCSAVINPPAGQNFGDEVSSGNYTFTGSVHNGGAEPLELPTVSLKFPSGYVSGLNDVVDSVLIEGIPAEMICKPVFDSASQTLTIGFNTILPGQTVNYSFEFKTPGNVVISKITPVLGGGYGKRDYTIEMIDDLVIIDDKRLGTDDYSFTSFNVYRYQEYNMFIDSRDKMTGLVSKDYDNYTPIEVQARTRNGSTWNKIGEIAMAPDGDCIYTPVSGKPTAWNVNNVNSTVENTAPLPEGTYAIKFVYKSNKFSLNFTFRVNIALNPTQTVKDLIKNKDSIQLYNVSTAIRKDADGVIHPLVSSAVGSDSAIIEIVKAHDTAQGYPVNRSHGMKKDTVYRKTNGITKTRYDAYPPFNEGQNNWGVQRQRIDAYDLIATGYGASIEEYIDYGILKHQTEGTFYVLFPMGTTFRPGSIAVAQHGYIPSAGSYPRVSDEYIQISTVSNWQDSGRTMLIVYVKLPEGTENISTWYGTMTDEMRMSGFDLSYELINPFDNMFDNGNIVETQVAYRSGNPRGLSEGKEAEFLYFQNLEGSTGRDDGNKNTIYDSTTTTFNPPVSAAIFGFTQSVQTAGDPSFRAAAEVSASEKYTYRLRFSSGTGGSRPGRLVFYDVLESGNGTNRNSWRGTLESIDLSHARSKGIQPVVYYSTSTSLDPASPPAIPNQVWAEWTSLDIVPAGITAVAIDFSKDESGNDWVMSADGESLYYLINMRAPSDIGNTENIAYNSASYSMQNTMVVANPPATTGTTGLSQVMFNALDTGFTVTYNGNGATGGSVPVDTKGPYAAGSLVTVLGNKGTSSPLTRTGYTFLGWAASRTATAPAYVENNTFAIGTGNVILYAVWQPVPTTANPGYTLTYNGNGATGGTPPKDSAGPYLAGSRVTILGQNDLVRTDHTFIGWSTSQNSNTAQYVGGNTFTINANTSLYAVWQKNGPSEAYTVVYLPGTHGSFSQQTTIDLAYGAPTPGAPRAVGQEGWKFNGWSPLVSPTVIGNATYTAQWVQASFIVTFEDHDGSVIKTESVAYNSEATPPDNPVREGYTFSRWSRPYTNVTSDITVVAIYAFAGEAPEVSTSFVSYPGDFPPEGPAIEGGEKTMFSIGGIPLLGGGLPAWALVNLILTFSGVLLAGVTVIRALKRRYDERIEEETTYRKDEDEIVRSSRPTWITLAVFACLAAVALFMFTEDMQDPVVLLDIWSIYHAAIFVVLIIGSRLGLKPIIDEEEDTFAQMVP